MVKKYIFFTLVILLFFASLVFSRGVEKILLGNVGFPSDRCVNPSMTYITSTIANSGENSFINGGIDTTTGHVYHTTNTNPAIVVKFSLNPFTRVDSLTIAEAPNTDNENILIDGPNGFGYIVTGLGAPNNLRKIQLSDMTLAGTVAFPAGSSTIFSSDIDPSTGLAYFGGGEFGFGKVYEYQLSTDTFTGTLTLLSSEPRALSLAIDTTRNNIHIGIEISPGGGGRIVVGSLPSLTRTNGVNLAAGENNPVSGVYDSSGDFFYWGTTSNPAIIIKTSPTPTRIGALTMTAGTENTNDSVVDSINGFAYFGFIANPGRIARIQLNNFSLLNTIIFPAGRANVRGMGIDILNQNIYAGSLETPSRTNQIGICNT